YAIVGRVVQCGAGVATYAAGDLVFALHPHQALFNAPVGLLIRLPTDLDPLLGVFCANLETALNIAHDTPLHLGETAVVFGQGVVGALAAQTLRLAGAGRVLVVDPLPARRARALQLGADAAFAPGDDLPAQIRNANGGRLADVALEVSGAPAALQDAIESVLDEGTIVLASWYGSKPTTLQLGGRFHRGRLTLRSSQVGRLNPALGPRWDYQRRLETVAALLPRLQLRELLTHRFPIAEAAAAYQLVDQRPGECGQVILTYE
ncbi:MAG: zinc-binding alcohol dehydrogenase, partial [Roseiflexaceae bacterium]|nr:zinc-binding alcohol dehydrogenase [Roseiflexaceae bacterium]